MLAQSAIATRRISRILLPTLCLVALAGFARAAELPAPVQTEVDKLVEQFLAKTKAPGLSVAIAVDWQPCFEKGYGLADVENNVPATKDTIYRLASISKMLTAVAAMQLVEAGELDLVEPIQKYVPKFPEKQAPITCELLLKHQSGIRHYRGDEVRSNTAYANVRDSFGVFQDDELLFTPGEKYSYTTYGYNVLGAAIEGASGEDYVRYVKEHIADPAGTEHLRPDSASKLIPHRAAGYRKSGPLLVNDYAVDVSNKIPGGGWCSTAGDLVRFASALNEGKLLKPETLEQMWTPQKTSEGKQTDSGFGCFIKEVEGDRRISHSGGQPKVSTFLVFSPAKKVAVAVMCNLRGAPVGNLANEILTLVTSKRPAAEPAAAAK